MFNPFQYTWVCEAEVPRNEAEAREPGPYDLMNTGVCFESSSPSELVKDSFKVSVSIRVVIRPVSCNGLFEVICTCGIAITVSDRLWECIKPAYRKVTRITGMSFTCLFIS